VICKEHRWPVEELSFHLATIGDELISSPFSIAGQQICVRMSLYYDEFNTHSQLLLFAMIYRQKSRTDSSSSSKNIINKQIDGRWRVTILRSTGEIFKGILLQVIFFWFISKTL
jgi:hypothetical protein